ncbi:MULTISPECIES: hypothetical protein [unclassified Pseudomonas]|uniref:hypothetical protein n=1 Tax=unclassified Pseudomonas TaxID=196821 RepID=UPI000A1FC54D|nr:MULTISPECIES: hypothetical protein [unclassified Pseudomonas]
MSHNPLCNCKQSLQTHDNRNEEPAAVRLRYAERLLEEVLDNPDIHYGYAIQNFFAEGRLSKERLFRPLAQFSALREAMEDAAASGKPCQLIVGDTHVTVTYQGIKWVHTQFLAGKLPLPLTIEEFDEIVAAALGGKP